MEIQVEIQAEIQAERGKAESRRPRVWQKTFHVAEREEIKYLQKEEVKSCDFT